MDEINRKWIRERLTGERGEQARMSSVTGISTDKLAKILNGTRRVQADEAPKLFKYFQTRGVQFEEDRRRSLLDIWSQLRPEEQDFLIRSAKGLLSQSPGAHPPEE